jgi:recombination protein RecA
MVVNTEEKDMNVKFITTNISSLDHCLGGGLPQGRIIEIFGTESGGKSSLAMHNIGIAQKLGGTCCLVDAEYAYDPDFAKALGVDTTKLKVIQPENGEQALSAVEEMVISNLFDVIVVDSVAALVPKAEVEGNMGDSHMGLQARLMSQALRKLTAIIGKTKCRLIFINQIRMKIGVMFGNPETTTGGNALKFYASVRLDVRRVKWLGNQEMPIGIRQKIKVVKNKVSPPFRQTELSFYFKTGFDVVQDIFDYCVNFGMFEKARGGYSYDGNLYKEEELLNFLRTDKDFRLGMKKILKITFEAQV